MIENFNQLMLGQYMDIQAISREEGLEDIDRQAQILSVLSGIDAEEILHLPIGEYKEMVAKADFLTRTELPRIQVAKSYRVGDFTLFPVKDYRKLEAGQYVDFQTYAPDLENHLVEFLSVILVPKGCRYNEGYDVLEVQQAIRDDMSVIDGVTIAGFFLTWCRSSILNSLNSSKQEAMRIKDREKREKILEEIASQERILGRGGDGSPT
jgi:hypothetical protein